MPKEKNGLTYPFIPYSNEYIKSLQAENKRLKDTLRLFKDNLKIDKDIDAILEENKKLKETLQKLKECALHLKSLEPDIKRIARNEENLPKLLAEFLEENYYIFLNEMNQMTSRPVMNNNQVIRRRAEQLAKEFLKQRGKESFCLFVEDKKFFVPITVMKEIQKKLREGFKKVEVIRSGKEKIDTKYIVLGV